MSGHLSRSSASICKRVTGSRLPETGNRQPGTSFQAMADRIQTGQGNRQLALKRNLAGDRFDRRKLRSRIRVVRADVCRQLRNVLQNVWTAEEGEDEWHLLRR